MRGLLQEVAMRFYKVYKVAKRSEITKINTQKEAEVSRTSPSARLVDTFLDS
jgi:hypothetical protein